MILFFYKVDVYVCFCPEPWGFVCSLSHAGPLVSTQCGVYGLTSSCQASASPASIAVTLWLTQ